MTKLLLVRDREELERVVAVLGGRMPKGVRVFVLEKPDLLGAFIVEYGYYGAGTPLLLDGEVMEWGEAAVERLKALQ